ncbi:transposase [Clostridium sp. JN-9]|uniref:transposase n=1 Tax=Clostridium sp. JN-9 TaxID=2507159 RepID=UPI000FFE32F6|nr:transposase [Clostridium sp. JN-9]QAT40801.1 hypothetical protein EQM05_11320 [Clostridium sp. JN-9]
MIKKDLQKSYAGRQPIKIKNVNGLPKTLKVSFSKATIQNCIVHQIRNSFLVLPITIIN